MSHALLLALLVLQAPSHGGVPAYQNDPYGFRIAIPRGWIQVPDSVVNARTEAMRRMGAPERDTNYPTAFVQAGRNWFAHPYVLVQINAFAADRPAPPSLGRVAADLNALGHTARYDPYPSWRTPSRATASAQP